MARLQHENLDGSADAPEVGTQAPQVSTEDLAALNTKFGSHSRGEAGLGTEEIQISAVEQSHHRPIAFDRKFVNPFGGDGEPTPRDRDFAYEQAKRKQ
jgi:hypothetical protein